MQNKYTYQTILQSSTSEFKDRGSKFLGYVFPINTVDDCKISLKIIRELHPKATHHCFAYRLGTDNLSFRASDDGEPSGSAGKPILGAIDSLEITDVIAIVVRYYGGTMLGVPGLIHAYKTTIKDAFATAEIIIKEKTQVFELEFDYNLIAIVNQTMIKLDAIQQRTENLLFCKKQIQIPYRNVHNAIEVFSKIHNLVFRKL